MGMHSLGDRLNQCSVHFGIINPKKKFILNPETMEYFSGFDKSWPMRLKLVAIRVALFFFVSVVISDSSQQKCTGSLLTCLVHV